MRRGDEPWILYGDEHSPQSCSPTSSSSPSEWSPIAMNFGTGADRNSVRHSNHDCRFNLATCAGCQGAPMDEVWHSESGEAAPHLYFSPFIGAIQGDDEHLDRATCPPSGVESASMDRALMKEEFHKVYFPAGAVDYDTDFMYSHFLPREVFDNMGAMMDAAVDALCLVQLGISRSDESLIDRARVRHQVAVGHLQLDMIDYTSTYDDRILGTMYLLGICEMFRPLSADGIYRRIYHTRLSELLQIRGPNQDYSKFAQVILYGFFQLALVRGLLERKAVPFAGRAWKDCAALTTGIMAKLGEHLIKVPGALAQADQITKRPQQTDDEILDAVIELASIERDMQAWIVHFYSTFESLPFWPENVEHFPDFRRHTSGAPLAFPKALIYPSFSHASAQVSFWIGMLQIKRTMLMLNRLSSTPILPKSERAIMAEATEHAEKLCESAAYLTQPRHGFCGILRASGPLFYASCWFVKQRELQKVAWCDVVRKSIRDQACFFQMLPDR